MEDVEASLGSDYEQIMDSPGRTSSEESGSDEITVNRNNQVVKKRVYRKNKKKMTKLSRKKLNETMPFRCEVLPKKLCHKRFATEKDLEAHKLSHKRYIAKKEDLPTFPCPVEKCKVFFLSEEELTVHHRKIHLSKCKLISYEIFSLFNE